MGLGRMVGLPLLSYWPNFGFARAKEMRTRHAMNSKSTSRLSGLAFFLEPWLGLGLGLELG